MAADEKKNIPFPEVSIDLIVYTREEIDRELKRENVFIAEILEKGKYLYGWWKKIQSIQNTTKIGF